MNRGLPPPQHLHALLTLDGCTGELRWKSTPGREHLAGEVAGSWSEGRHGQVRIDRHRYLVHRVVYCMAFGVDPGAFFVDHVNGDVRDNRPCNLRLATPAQNAANQHQARTGARGVAWCKQKRKWKVTVGCGGKNHHGGMYEDFEDAIARAAALRSELLGAFAGSDGRAAFAIKALGGLTTK